jgi:hypothetical protein
MMRWPTRAIFSLTSGPIAATVPHGSWPPMTGFGLTGRPPIDSPPDFGPAVLMQIAAAHAGGLHLDDDLTGSRGRVRKLHQLDFTLALEDHAAHRSPHGTHQLRRRTWHLPPAATAG